MEDISQQRIKTNLVGRFVQPTTPVPPGYSEIGLTELGPPYEVVAAYMRADRLEWGLLYALDVNGRVCSDLDPKYFRLVERSET